MAHHKKPAPSPTPTPVPVTIVAADPCTDPDPLPLWKQICAVSPARHEQFATGGPDGGPFRRMTVLDGDDFYGERAELGQNDWRDTFAVYREGEHKRTSFWLRLPLDFPISTYAWQCLMQMKQSWPSNNGGVDSPRISLNCFDGLWRFRSDLAPDAGFWTTPAKLGVWTHIVWDVLYSIDPAKGHAQLSIDGASSPVISMPTLVKEIAGPNTAIAPGDPIPSHLRMGVYHNAALPGTSVDIAGVLVETIS